MIGIAHHHGVKTLIDAAQSVAHIPVDVQELDADFLVFSGHKISGRPESASFTEKRNCWIVPFRIRAAGI